MRDSGDVPASRHHGASLDADEQAEGDKQHGEGGEAERPQAMIGDRPARHHRGIDGPDSRLPLGLVTELLEPADDLVLHPLEGRALVLDQRDLDGVGCLVLVLVVERLELLLPRGLPRLEFVDGGRRLDDLPFRQVTFPPSSIPWRIIGDMVFQS